MSRSKHTRPRRILAATRLQAPYEPRGSNDPSRQRRIARLLKESGLVGQPATSHGVGPAPLPRIAIQQPQIGYQHPLTRPEIEDVLRFFGETCYYGLRLIELVRGQERMSHRRLLFGRLSVPGRITIYAQPPSPWVMMGGLPTRQEDLLRRAGALVQATDMGMRTRVVWPGETLCDFMLFDVLMHEVGHHIIQQYKGKRTMRVVRTRDHEAFADHFAARCRLAYQHTSAEV